MVLPYRFGSASVKKLLKSGNRKKMLIDPPVKCQLKETHLHFQWKEGEGEQETKRE
jgi:hypothetical protein